MTNLWIGILYQQSTGLSTLLFCVLPSLNEFGIIIIIGEYVTINEKIVHSLFRKPSVKHPTDKHRCECVFFFFQFKDTVLNIMAGVEVNRLNLVTKVAVITAYSTKRVDNSLPQSTQVCSKRLFWTKS